MIDDLYKNTDLHMKKCVELFKLDINKIRTGRVVPGVLDNIKVEYFGVPTPIYKLANIIVEDPRTLLITVFDSSIVLSIKKSILSSGLGFTPSLSGCNIRISVSPLTEEQRRNLIKLVHRESEKGKISIRSIRRAANDRIKYLSKDKKINKDKEHYIQGKVQFLTDFWIKEIDHITVDKEYELMKF